MDSIIKKKQNLHSSSMYSVGRQFIIASLLCSLFLLFFNSSVLAAGDQSETNANTNVAIGAASLILQPVYLAIKLAIGITGTAFSRLTLLGTGGDEETAGKIFKDSWASPLGMPELFNRTDGQENTPS